MRARSRLTLIELLPKADAAHRRGRYRCECGVEHEARVSHVTSGATRSCGCLVRELSSRMARKHLKPYWQPKRYATRNDYLAAWRDENRAKINDQQRAWKRRNPEKVTAEVLLRAARKRVGW